MEELLGNDTEETENIKFMPSPYYTHDKFIPVDMKKMMFFAYYHLNVKVFMRNRLFILTEELRNSNFKLMSYV